MPSVLSQLNSLAGTCPGKSHPFVSRNRFYSPDLGRFISSDPLGMVDGPNTYGFCGGDPVNRGDPMGTDWYESQEDGDYYWFDGNKPIPGYRHIGPELRLPLTLRITNDTYLVKKPEERRVSTLQNSLFLTLTVQQQGGKPTGLVASVERDPASQKTWNDWVDATGYMNRYSEYAGGGWCFANLLMWFRREPRDAPLKKPIHSHDPGALYLIALPGPGTTTGDSPGWEKGSHYSGVFTRDWGTADPKAAPAYKYVDDPQNPGQKTEVVDWKQNTTVVHKVVAPELFPPEI